MSNLRERVNDLPRSVVGLAVALVCALTLGFVALGTHHANAAAAREAATHLLGLWPARMEHGRRHVLSGYCEATVNAANRQVAEFETLLTEAHLVLERGTELRVAGEARDALYLAVTDDRLQLHAAYCDPQMPARTVQETAATARYALLGLDDLYTDIGEARARVSELTWGLLTDEVTGARATIAEAIAVGETLHANTYGRVTNNQLRAALLTQLTAAAEHYANLGVALETADFDELLALRTVTSEVQTALTTAKQAVNADHAEWQRLEAERLEQERLEQERNDNRASRWWRRFFRGPDNDNQ